MLVADISLVNLRFDGRRLVRREPAAPTLIVVGLPPQHVREEVPGKPDPTADPPGSLEAFTSGVSQLVFSVPPEVESLDLSLTSLLDWERLVPMTVPLLQPGAPAPGLPGSVLEFPTRLFLTYDEPVTWTCRPEPHDADGRTGLWHALLNGERGGEALLRALRRAEGRPPVPAHAPLTEENLEDLVTLTSRTELIDADKAPVPLPSAPLRAEQFVATPLGASAHLHGAWDEVSSDAKEQFRTLMRRSPELVAYDHITGLGRDQFVRVVTRGCLSLGHPALLVSEFKRLFVAHKDDGVVAYLQREDRILPREPEVHYGEGTGFPNQGREMPFRVLRITDRVTPPLKPVWPPRPLDRPDAQPQATEPFWVELEGGGDHQFTVLATDHEGRKVSFTTPLVFVPDSRTEDWKALNDLHTSDETKEKKRLERPLHGQVMAMAQPPADAPGSTAHAVGELAFALVRKEAGGRHPLAGMLVVSSAEVRVPALEPFAPEAGDVSVEFDPVYRDRGMAAHPARAYLDLKKAVGLDFAAEKAGGLARPNAEVKVITSQAGVVPDMFRTGPTGVVEAADMRDVAKAFDGAKLLGLVDLSALLAPVTTEHLGRLKQLGDAEIQNLLDDAEGVIPAPVLRVRDLADGTGRELRYVWKTKLQKPQPASPDEVFLLDVTRAVLTLDARTAIAKDGGQKTSVEGRLRNVALVIGGVVRVDIADLRFRAVPGNKPDVSASGLEMRFLGELRFIDTLRSALPADAFGSGAYVDVQPWGIHTGYALALPTIGIGVFSLANVSLKAELAIPFDPGKAISFRFSVSERQRPFNVTVSLFGGGGYFSLLVDAAGGIEVEGAIEFGGGAALNLGVASGGVSIMAGVRFEVRDKSVKVGGYLRCNGFLSVLGIVTVSVEFYLELTYEKHAGGSVVRGRGTLTVSVKIAFFSKSVSLELERSFPGAPGDPSFVDCFDEETHWKDYCLSFDGAP